MQKNDSSIWFQTIISSLTLFTSLGTLLCCALPALMVTLGMGATLAGLITVIPALSLISNIKEYIFLISGLLIFLGFFFQFRAKNFSCPSDPRKAKLCKNLRKISWILLYISLILYFIGFFFAFIAVHLFF